MLRPAVEQKRSIEVLHPDKSRVVEPHDYGVHGGMIERLACQVGRSLAGILRTTFVSGLLIFLISTSGSTHVALYAQRTRIDDPTSCRNLAQGFYDWYVPYIHRDDPGVTRLVAIRERPNLFSPELVRLIKDDAGAQAKSDEIVGLDFDPFIFGQDSDDTYMVDDVKRQGNRCLVSVYGIIDEKKREKPSVVPELMLKGNQWIFVNFHYPNPTRPIDENLLSILKALRVYRRNIKK
jgi:hypothetical protein